MDIHTNRVRESEAERQIERRREAEEMKEINKYI